MSGTEIDTKSSQQNIGAAMPSASEGTLARHQKPLLVLIADDEEPVAEAIAFLVQDAGYIPLVANNGRMALELARQEHPVLVITDLMMPYLSGDQLIRALREDAAKDNHAPPAIILLSAAGLQGMLNAGADAILPKPFEPDDLEKLLRRFLGQPPEASST